VKAIKRICPSSAIRRLAEAEGQGSSLLKLYHGTLLSTIDKFAIMLYVLNGPLGL
jgi:hypothetical protein